MRYYIVHVEQKNAPKVFKQFTNLREAKLFIRRRKFLHCGKHYWGNTGDRCECTFYSLYSIMEKELSKVEYGKQEI